MKGRGSELVIEVSHGCNADAWWVYFLLNSLSNDTLPFIVAVGMQPHFMNEFIYSSYCPSDVPLDVYFRYVPGMSIPGHFYTIINITIILPAPFCNEHTTCTEARLI